MKRKTDIQSSLFSDSLIAESRISERSSHRTLGRGEALLRARKTGFWPGFPDYIRNAVKACDICQKHKPAQQKERLIPHDVPSMSWAKLRINIFEYHSHHFLLVSYYFKKLSNQMSCHMIGLLKIIFTE